MARSLVSLLLLAGCNDYALDGDLGVSPGGSQDVGYAREIVEAGGIPGHEHFTAEGLFSEHDLPLASPGCDAVLCPVAAATPYEPVDGSGAQALVQIGFDTVLTAETFERPPLALAVAVDVSGSMEGGKLEAVKHALQVMIDQLGPDDRMALVAFDDRAWVEREPTVMDEAGRARMADTVDALRPMGGTDIEAGLALAYGEIAPTAAEAGVEHRVLLLTDAQPNDGATGMDSLLGMARYYAEVEIGLSVFGVGLDMGTELADAIARTRGGSYHYLATEEDVRQVFDEDFDYLVTPLAYDLAVEVAPAPGVSLLAGWGMPVDGPSSPVTLGASTLFLSARDGGMGLSFDAEALRPGTPLARFALAYETPDGVVVEDALDVAWEGGATLAGREVEADDVGVYKMSGLLDEFHALSGGAELCLGNLPQADALARIDATVARLDAMAAHLDDAPLADEAALMRKLRENVQAGVERCAPADTYAY